MSFAVAIYTIISTATDVAIAIPTEVGISISIYYLLFSISIANPIATSTAITIDIPTEIAIAVSIYYLLFNTTLTDYNWKVRTNWTYECL